MTKQNQHLSLWLILLLILPLLPACGGDSDDKSADGDAPVYHPDGDTPDGDSPDGDDPADGDTPDGDNPADGDDIEPCEGNCNSADYTKCSGDNVCICESGSWNLYNCSDICEGQGKCPAGCGVADYDYPYCICSDDQNLCENDDPDGDTPDGDDPLENCPADDDVFDPNNPGTSIDFLIASMDVMGQATTMAVGILTPAAREQFETAAAKAEQPLDTCQFLNDTASTPSCQYDTDCAPEQVCLPETSDGQPIENSERCVTEVEPVDVGPFTVSGFVGQPKTFAYNAGQSGAYTEGGQGDGQIDPASIAFDTDYELDGTGDAAQGLGAYAARFHSPAQITLTSPPVTMDPQWQIPVISVNPAQDLTFTWDGSDNPDNTLTLSLSGGNGTLNCRLRDDGQHVVSSADLTALGFNAMLSMMNAVTVQSDAFAPICGSGVTRGQVTFQQMIMLFAQVAQ